MAEIPNYEEMSLDELSEACDQWHQRLLEARAQIRAGRNTLPAAERFTLEMQVGEAQAHMNMIQPLRTAHFIREEYERSQEAERMRGRLSDEDYQAMLQKIGVPYIEGESRVYSTE